MAKLTITNSGTVDDFKLTEVYAEYRKFSFHLVEKCILKLTLVILIDLLFKFKNLEYWITQEDQWH